MGSHLHNQKGKGMEELKRKIESITKEGNNKTDLMFVSHYNKKRWKTYSLLNQNKNNSLFNNQIRAEGCKALSVASQSVNCKLTLLVWVDMNVMSIDHFLTTSWLNKTISVFLPTRLDMKDARPFLLHCKVSIACWLDWSKWTWLWCLFIISWQLLGKTKQYQSFFQPNWRWRMQGHFRCIAKYQLQID